MAKFNATDLLLVFFIFIFSQSSKAETTQEVLLDLPSAIQEVRDGTSIVVDLRSSTQIGSVSIENAYWVQLPEIVQDLPVLYKDLKRCFPKGVKVYLFCYVGSFAAYFAEGLKSHGVNAVAAGGFHDWLAAGAHEHRIDSDPLSKTCPF